MIERRVGDIRADYSDSSLPSPDDAEKLFMDGLARWARRKPILRARSLTNREGYAYEFARDEIVSRFSNARRRVEEPIRTITFSDYERESATARARGEGAERPRGPCPLATSNPRTTTRTSSTASRRRSARRTVGASTSRASSGSKGALPARWTRRFG